MCGTVVLVSLEVVCNLSRKVYDKEFHSRITLMRPPRSQISQLNLYLVWPLWHEKGRWSNLHLSPNAALPTAFRSDQYLTVRETQGCKFSDFSLISDF